ncbi:MAG TPA: DNA polymerase III subunit alpha [Candidatus Saccharimonadales bacterium]|nr:DNA polymerase III subunit alpha [Candidatus Saccharimonadales bacterium]
MPKKKTLVPSDYVHLHNHTQYSLLDGLTKIPALIDGVKNMGMEAVAITDHGTLSGAIEFYKTATSENIKPIIGMETYVAPRSHTDKDPSKDKTPFHLTLLAMNNVGYQNLMRLSTIANLEGFYYRPRVDHEMLETYNDGLIVLSGCIGGEIGDALKQDQYAQAKQVAMWYKKVLGDRYYLEVQDHGHSSHPKVWDEQVKVNEQIFQLGKELDIPCVVTCDAHYLRHEDQEAHEILLCVQTGSFLSDEKRMTLKDFELHVTNPKEIIKRWGKEHPEVIQNSRAIADRCEVTLELGQILIPKFTVPRGETERSYLEKLVYQGLAWRYGGVGEDKAAKLDIDTAKKKLTKEVIERATYELATMNSMGFNGYFLIVQDFINWGKDRGIIFGPGRGSAAGSIVAYAIRITEIEPLSYNLMFERFLNPSRISMPDIDIDIQDTRRDEVIQYCIDKYGKDRVANIVTFGRMAARNAVRDVSRVLQVPYAEADRLAKMIPPPVQGRHILLEKSIKENSELKREYRSNPTAKRVFDLAIQLEGTIRSHGVHAAGVVIAPDEIVHYVPLEMAQKGVVATQYSMGPIEDLGLLKIDFLGLSNLTVIKNALRIVKKVFGKDIELSTIPIDDTKTFELLQRADTTGVFQLESSGMKRYLKQLRPTLFEDIIAMGALYRPGPMSEIPRFIEGKNNPASIQYLHKSLEPILSDTYGVMVYQEQIIKLLQLVAGYTPGEADLIRKAIGKKKRDIMQAEEPRFIEGCIKQGLTASNAHKLWSQIQPFADYSFNRAHATCYAQISYWTAYLKAHYPEAFMAALMTSDFDNIDRLAIEINECKHIGIQVLPPDVNESFVEFAVVPKSRQIRFGMAAIKNVGTGAVEEILRARQEGRFKSLEDFLSKVNSRVVNRKTIESLIKSGAFDNFADRSQLLHNIDVLMAYGQRLQKEREGGQTDLFGASLDDTNALAPRLVIDTDGVPHSQREQLQWERDLLGIYLSQHPLQAYEAYLRLKTNGIDSITAQQAGHSITVGGAISEVREITTKNGQKMAFIKLADMNSEIELVLFPKTYDATNGIWERDRVVIVKGQVSTRGRDGTDGNEPKLMVNEAREVTFEEISQIQDEEATQLASVTAQTIVAIPHNTDMISQRLYIRLPSSKDQKVLTMLKQTIDQHQGDTEVVLVLGADEQKQAIKLPLGISSSQEALEELETLVGKPNIKLH